LYLASKDAEESPPRETFCWSFENNYDLWPPGMPESATAPALDPSDNNAYLIYIPAAVFVVICPVLMALRIWARLRKGGKLGADDWTAIAALVSGSICPKTCSADS
jgi:hypothetical protein